MKKSNLLKAFFVVILLQIFLFTPTIRAEERFVGKHQDGTRYYIIDEKVLEKTVKVWVKEVPNKNSAFYKNYMSFLNLTGAKGESYAHSIVDL